MTISAKDKAKAAVGVKKATKRVLGRTGGADLTSKPAVKLVSKSRFGVVRNAGHKAAFTSQVIALSHTKASRLGDAVGNLGKPRVTLFKRIGGKRGAGAR